MSKIIGFKSAAFSYVDSASLFYFCNTEAAPLSNTFFKRSRLFFLCVSASLLRLGGGRGTHGALTQLLILGIYLGK